MQFCVRHRAPLLLLLCFAGLATAAQRPANRGPAVAPISPADAAMLRAGLDAYDKGDAAQAEAKLRPFLLRHPRNYAANEAVGSIYAEAGDAVKALPFLSLACGVAPGEAVAHANLGAVYLKLGKTTDGLRELRTSATLAPQNQATQISLGQALLLTNQPRAAIGPLRTAARLSPQDPATQYALAYALFESGSVPEAADLLDRIPAASMNEEMHALAADADERTGRFALALPHFQAAARVNPSDANLFALVAELLRHWNWAEAIEVAQYAASRYPESTHFILAAGIAAYGNSDYKTAAQVFSGLLEKDPDNAAVADLLGRSCAAMPDGVSPDCQEIYGFVERHPGNAIMSTYAANTLLREPGGKRDLDKAASLLHAAIVADPDLADAYLSLGKLEQMRLQWKESATALEHAAALQPEMAEAHYRLSRAYAHLGRREDAQTEIALHQKYSRQAKDSLNARMQEVMRFILNPS